MKRKLLMLSLLLVIGAVVSPENIQGQCTGDMSGNLIVNGDFETPLSSGDISSYSNYNYTTGTPTPGNWTIGTPTTLGSGSFASATNNGIAGDHTKQNNTGKYMLIDVNADPGKLAWKTQVNVVPNTKYFFSAWIANVNRTNSNPSKLVFAIDGAQISNKVISPPGPPASGTNYDHSWVQFYTEWNSGVTSGPVIISMKNILEDGNGNDLALDDIVFSTSCQYVQLPKISQLQDTVNICNNNPVTLDSKITDSGSFQWFQGNTSTPVGANTPTHTASAAGLYYLCFNKSGYNCPQLDSIYVKDAPLQITTTQTNPTTCGGADGTITLSGLKSGESYDVSYTFNGNTTTLSGLVANANQNIVLTGLSEGNYTGIIAKLNSCESNAEQETLTDPSKPVIGTSSVHPTLCGNADGKIIITGFSPNVAYAISYFDGSNTMNANKPATVATTYEILNLGAGSYNNITVTLKNCRSNERSETLIDPGVPAISASPVNPSTCGGNDGSFVIVGLTSGVSYDVSYSKDGSSAILLNARVADAQGSVVVNNLSKGAISAIKVKITGSSCESNSVSLSLVDPNPPIANAISHNPTTCSGSEGRISITNLTNNRNYEVNYSYGGTTRTASGLIASSNQIAITSLSAGLYTQIVLKDLTTQCTAPLPDQTLTDPLPPVITVSATQPINCGGDGSIIIRNLLSFSDYTVYYNNPSLAGPFVMTSNSTGVINLPVKAGTYQNIRVSINNCMSNAGMATLIDPVVAPALSITASNVDICKGETVQFTTVPVSGGAAPTYRWSVNGAAVAVGPTFTTSGLNNNDQISAIMTSSALCAFPKTSASNTIRMKVTEKPVAMVTGNVLFCQGQSLTLTAAGGTSAASYQWLKNSNPLLNARSIHYTDNTGGNYQVIVAEGRCKDTSEIFTTNMVNITVNAGPDKDTLIDTFKGDNLTEIMLTGKSNGNSPQWKPSESLFDSRSRNSVAVLSPGRYVFTLYDSIAGCGSSDIVVVNIRTKIRIPDAFSPNGDADNELWYITGLEEKAKYTVQVFNRYGSLMHEQKNNYVPWDGTFHGEPVPVGTYYYIVDIAGDKAYSSTLTIIR